jgi:hypothetical protein
MERLVKEGKLIADSRTNLARSGTGVEVRTGAPKPDVSTVEAFKRAPLNAKSIGYLRGCGGVELVGPLPSEIQFYTMLWRASGPTPKYGTPPEI